MAVIKKQYAAPLLKEAIVLDLGDVGRQAARIMAAAEDKARRLVADAEKRASEMIANAQQQGYDQGYQEGYAKGLAEGTDHGLQQGHEQAYSQANEILLQIQQTWIGALQQWEAQQTELGNASRESVLELALRLTEKLVHRVVQVDNTVVLDQISLALAHVMGDTQVVVRICPEDRPLVESHLPSLVSEFPNLTHARLVDDPQISPGGCVVTYGQGRIDGTLEMQLARAVDLILPEPESAMSHDEELPEVMNAGDAADFADPVE